MNVIRMRRATKNGEGLGTEIMGREVHTGRDRPRLKQEKALAFSI